MSGETWWWEDWLARGRYGRTLQRGETGRLLEAAAPRWARGLLVGNVGARGARLALSIGRDAFGAASGMQFDLRAGAFAWCSAIHPVVKVDVVSADPDARIGYAWTREAPVGKWGAASTGDLLPLYQEIGGTDPVQVPPGAAILAATVDDAGLQQVFDNGMTTVTLTTPVGPGRTAEVIGDYVVPTVAPNLFYWGIRLP